MPFPGELHGRILGGMLQSRPTICGVIVTPRQAREESSKTAQMSERAERFPFFCVRYWSSDREHPSCRAKERVYVKAWTTPAPTRSRPSQTAAQPRPRP